MNLGKQLCHSYPAIIHSDPNLVLYKQEWINSSNCLPYRTDSYHIPRTTHYPSPHSLSWSQPLHILCCAGAALKTGPFMMSTGLFWTAPAAECHAGGWMQVASSLPAWREHSTNVTLWVWPTALIQKKNPDIFPSKTINGTKISSFPKDFLIHQLLKTCSNQKDSKRTNNFHSPCIFPCRSSWYAQGGRGLGRLI